jgi:hypothetical protein
LPPKCWLFEKTNEFDKSQGVNSQYKGEKRRNADPTLEVIDDIMPELEMKFYPKFHHFVIVGHSLRKVQLASMDPRRKRNL